MFSPLGDTVKLTSVNWPRHLLESREGIWPRTSLLRKWVAQLQVHARREAHEGLAFKQEKSNSGCLLSVGIRAAWLLVLTLPTQHIVNEMRSLQESVDRASVIAAAFAAS